MHRLLQQVGHAPEEPRGGGTVNHPVIITERKRNHQAGYPLAIFQDGILPTARNTQDRHLGPVDNGREARATDPPQIGDGEGAPTEV